MPGNGSIGLHGLAVDHRLLDATSVRKVMTHFPLFHIIYTYIYLYDISTC